MTSSGRWKTLDLEQSTAPKLLLKSHFTATGYHVQLTDLCRVWDETITKRELIRRAWDDGCSIDPSEDDQQFKIFLEKIDGALNGEDGTTMALLPDGNDRLLLRLSAPLPKPLPTLTWTVLLARQSDEELANVLTIPLLHEANNLQLQVQQLVHELQEKDRVISKITDRLETSGNDLTTVFPGVSNIKTSKKKSQREQLARHVKGLADFDEAAWRSRAAGGERGDLWDRVDGVLRGMPEPKGIDDDESIKKKWWLELQTKQEATPKTSTPPLDTSTTAKTANGVDLSHEDSMVDDEFQRQGTPERLKHRESARSENLTGADEVSHSEPPPRQQAVQIEGDSTTEDEDDLDAVTTNKPTPSVAKRQYSPALQASPPGPSKKLGAIGGRSSKPPPSPAKEPTPEEQPEPAKSRNKLGAIGGKAKASESPTSPSAEDTAPPASSAPRKMGVIGGKRKPSNAVPPAAASPNATPSPEPVMRRSRAPTTEPTPQPRETSQERADRKRDELKRALEQKAKVPAKKKRKF